MSDSLSKTIKDNQDLVKAFVIKSTDSSSVNPTSNSKSEDHFSKAKIQKKLIIPAYSPKQLDALAESSSILNPCIDVMEVNCDSFGHEFIPSVDEETFRLLREEQENSTPKTELIEIDREHRDLKNLFKYINRKYSFIQLRRRTRRDYELTGNGYWEILRNRITNKITGAEWLPSAGMRLGKLDKQFTDCISKKKINDIEITEVPDKRKFRRFAQIQEAGNNPVWFKEFGDPRLMDADTGAYATFERDSKGKMISITALQEEGFDTFSLKKLKDGKMRLANEVLHFVNYNSVHTLPYGTPRWMGNLISIMGSRAAEEINYSYFDNKTVPPGMLLVSGGKLGKSSVDRITTHINDTIKGRKNFHSILCVEAMNEAHPNMPAPVVPKLEWVNMTNAQHGDALFQKYDQNNIDKIVSCFRFWPGYVSRTKDVNRATASTAKKLSEEQVFSPERAEFDSIINRTILVDMDINYYEFKSKGVELTSSEDRSNALDKTKGYLTIKEARAISSSILNKELDTLPDSPWVNVPVAVLSALATNPDALEAILPPEIALVMKASRDERDAKTAAIELQKNENKTKKNIEKSEAEKFISLMKEAKEKLADSDQLQSRS